MARLGGFFLFLSRLGAIGFDERQNMLIALLVYSRVYEVDYLASALYSSL